MLILSLSCLEFWLMRFRCRWAGPAGKFFNPFSLTLILQQVAIVGIVGAAQTLVILTAGIDLSVGAVMVLSSVVMGQFTFRYGIPVPISILCGLACGALCGFINGWLVANMKLPPFIVTLGTWQVYNATKYLYSKNETIRGQDIEAQAPLLQLFGIADQVWRRGLHPGRHLHGAARRASSGTSSTTRPGAAGSMRWVTILKRPHSPVFR